MRENLGESELEGLSAFDGVAVARQMRGAIDDLLEERGQAGDLRTRIAVAVGRAGVQLRALGEDEMATILEAN